MPKLKPQTRFLLRGSILLVGLLSFWWFLLLSPMLYNLVRFRPRLPVGEPDHARHHGGLLVLGNPRLARRRRPACRSLSRKPASCCAVRSCWWACLASGGSCCFLPCSTC